MGVPGSGREESVSCIGLVDNSQVETVFRLLEEVTSTGFDAKLWDILNSGISIST